MVQFSRCQKDCRSHSHKIILKSQKTKWSYCCYKKVMAEAGKPDSSTNVKEEKMEVAGSDDTMARDALLIQHYLDSSKKSKGQNKLPPTKYPDPADEGDEDEITRKCHAYQAQQNQGSK
ncbi:uncharacterized protein LOC117342402 isoform X2 [Pecten maximus]|uniref:uncharacterized protein LOC117342402 isoform X2 n=1 Tax=Pecten maximus TaxID=6579 RepID=UPI001457FCC7|nr:uncharacterized protein LOC117342402 isoform X2 [Pecten maximus]